MCSYTQVRYTFFNKGFNFKKMQCLLQLFMDLNALLVQNLSQDDLAKNNFVQS